MSYIRAMKASRTVKLPESILARTCSTEGISPSGKSVVCICLNAATVFFFLQLLVRVLPSVSEGLIMDLVHLTFDCTKLFVYRCVSAHACHQHVSQSVVCVVLRLGVYIFAVGLGERDASQLLDYVFGNWRRCVVEVLLCRGHLQDDDVFPSCPVCDYDQKVSSGLPVSSLFRQSTGRILSCSNKTSPTRCSAVSGRVVLLPLFYQLVALLSSV